MEELLAKEARLVAHERDLTVLKPVHLDILRYGVLHELRKLFKKKFKLRQDYKAYIPTLLISDYSLYSIYEGMEFRVDTWSQQIILVLDYEVSLIPKMNLAEIIEGLFSKGWNQSDIEDALRWKWLISEPSYDPESQDRRLRGKIERILFPDSEEYSQLIQKLDLKLMTNEQKPPLIIVSNRSIEAIPANELYPEPKPDSFEEIIRVFGEDPNQIIKAIRIHTFIDDRLNPSKTNKAASMDRYMKIIQFAKNIAKEFPLLLGQMNFSINASLPIPIMLRRE
jgi:hypothetical protein